VTIEHDEIRSWVEEHGGHPAVVKGVRGRGPGILRIDFPGFSGEDSLQEIAWDDFFARFDEAELAFLYQDKTAAGRPSRFNKLVSRETVGLSAPARRGSGVGPSARRGPAEPGRATRGRTKKAAKRARPSAPSRRKATARGRSA
jgi:hypothetical protein